MALLIPHSYTGRPAVSRVYLVSPPPEFTPPLRFRRALSYALPPAARRLSFIGFCLPTRTLSRLPRRKTTKEKKKFFLLLPRLEPATLSFDFVGKRRKNSTSINIIVHTDTVGKMATYFIYWPLALGSHKHEIKRRQARFSLYISRASFWRQNI